MKLACICLSGFNILPKMRLWFVILGCFFSAQHILWIIKNVVRKLSVSSIGFLFCELEFAKSLFCFSREKKVPKSKFVEYLGN